MITKRIIPCLDVKDGRVVKGVNFAGLADVNDPVALGKFYSDNGADELVFYDITASAEGRRLFTDVLTQVASTIFIPLTVGGGINTLEDFDRVLKCGADKVSVNSGALRDPSLIGKAAKKYGDQCVVLSIDARRVDGQYHVFARGGREDTGRELLDWVRRGMREPPEAVVGRVSRMTRGQLLSAIQNRDYPVIQGYVLITGTTFVLITLAIDLLYLAVDPKIRLQGGEA